MRFFKSNTSSRNENKRTDSELISEYKRLGDNNSIEILFDRYAHLVYGLCFKYLKNEEESRDAVINIFEKLLVSLKKYEIKNFTTWIHSVAKNYCLAQIQRNKARLDQDENSSLPSEAEMLVADTSAYDEEQLKDLEFRKLEEAMQTLNTEQKTCIELFYLKERCYQEIAETTGYTINQVKSYIQNGKRNLKLYLMKSHGRFE